jgi:hypothetical protein
VRDWRIGKVRDRPDVCPTSDVVHLFFFAAFVEKLLEGDAVGGGVDGGFEAAPGGAEFGGAVGVAQRGGVEDFALHGAEDVAEGDFGGFAGEEVAAFFAADAFGDAFGFQFEEDLHEVIRRHTLRGGQVLDAQGGFIRKMSRQAQYRARGIIAFDRKLHGGRVAERGWASNIEHSTFDEIAGSRPVRRECLRLREDFWREADAFAAVQGLKQAPLGMRSWRSMSAASWCICSAAC